MMSKSNSITSCSFCHKTTAEVNKLMTSNGVAICDRCVNTCYQHLNTNESKNNAISPANLDDKKIPVDSHSIKAHLDKYVIGQEAAKRVISVAVTNHYKRIHFKNPDVELSKSNIMMLGPTGSGKTLLARTVAKFLDVPFIMGDATTLSETGFSGRNVEDLVQQLLKEAKGDVARCQTGIIFIDEIDKIARKSRGMNGGSEITGENVQAGLLKLVEGTICKVDFINPLESMPIAVPVDIDTSHILFIVGGAFTGLDEIINKRLDKSGMGFTSSVNSKFDKSSLSRVAPEDLTKFGLLPEFVGRFPCRVSLTKLTVDELVYSLTQIKNNLIAQYRELFRLDQIELEFDPEALQMIAERCIISNTGARGLQNELERVLLPFMFDIPVYKANNITQIVIGVDQIGEILDK